MKTRLDPSKFWVNQNLFVCFQNQQIWRVFDLKCF